MQLNYCHSVQPPITSPAALLEDPHREVRDETQENTPRSGIVKTAISLAVLASLLTVSVIVAGATSNSSGEDPLGVDTQSYATEYGTTV